jgi:uncharacterized membrane protein
MDAALRLEWLVIGLMGLVTFVTRVAGVGLARWVPQTPFWQSFVQHLPTTLLVAIAAPAFASGDPILTIAAIVTLLAATRGLNLIVCMSLGVGVVALMRALSG